MDENKFEINERVKVNNLLQRPQWNGHIVTISDISGDLVEIKEFEGDEISQRDRVNGTWINKDKVEKLYRLPEELFEI